VAFFGTKDPLPVTKRLAAMLAELQILIFCNAISSSSGGTFIVQSFVAIFIYSFSIGLILRAERYKFPTEPQALSLCVMLWR
jgi:hypothetical protein